MKRSKRNLQLPRTENDATSSVESLEIPPEPCRQTMTDVPSKRIKLSKNRSPASEDTTQPVSVSNKVTSDKRQTWTSKHYQLKESSVEKDKSFDIVAGKKLTTTEEKDESFKEKELDSKKALIEGSSDRKEIENEEKDEFVDDFVKLFGGILVSFSLFRSRGIVCTLEKLAPVVLASTGKTFNLDKLIVLCKISPKLIGYRCSIEKEEIYRFADNDDDDGFGSKDSTLEVVLYNLKWRVSSIPTPKQIERKTTIFRKNLISFIEKFGIPDFSNVSIHTGPEFGNLPPTIPSLPSLPSLPSSASSETSTSIQSSSQIASFVEHLRSCSFYTDQIKYVHIQKKKVPQYGSVTYAPDIQDPYDPLNVKNGMRDQEDQQDDSLRFVDQRIRRALYNIGISRLYLHQDTAIKAALSKKNVCICTSTSSGKSVTYNVPVVQSILDDPSSTAIYLFPTKALAQDQLRSLNKFLRSPDNFDDALTKVNCHTYDGDTPKPQRKIIQTQANIILTNPDMLHSSILPGHKSWPRLFEKLKFIVIDEAHMYRGVFGSHVAMIFRRLMRICQLYNSWPQFIGCTATIANPVEHFLNLIPSEEPPTLISADTSVSGEKCFLLWNPSEYKNFEDSKLQKGTEIVKELGNEKETKYENIDAASSNRRSPTFDAALIFCELVSKQFRTICFCKVRNVCELIYQYSLSILAEGVSLSLTPYEMAKKYKEKVLDSSQQRFPGNKFKIGPKPQFKKLISSYRGGYSSDNRRQIESDLFGGDLLGVISTNALELGVDIGGLDATIQVGFPGSVCSLKQQSGRAGRSGRDSVCIIVAYGNSPLDQFCMRNPSVLFEKPSERAIANPYNKHILWQHLVCAANEMSLVSELDHSIFGGIELFTEVCETLCRGLRPDGTQVQGGSVLRKNEGGYHHTHLIGNPWKATNIRAIDEKQFQVIEEVSGACIDEIGESRVFFQIFPGAVFLHQGVQYLVTDLLLDLNKAYVSKKKLSYFTNCRDQTDVILLNEISRKEIHKDVAVSFASVNIKTQVYGYHKLDAKQKGVILETVDLNLPDTEFSTFATWINVQERHKALLLRNGHNYRGSLHAISHALCSIAPLHLMCDFGDIGTECISPYESRQRPLRILMYDKRTGGSGISELAFDIIDTLLQSVFNLILTCFCKGGCPECIQNTICSEYNAVLDKEGALLLLKELL